MDVKSKIYSDFLPLDGKGFLFRTHVYYAIILCGCHGCPPKKSRLPPTMRKPANQNSKRLLSELRTEGVVLCAVLDNHELSVAQHFLCLCTIGFGVVNSGSPEGEVQVELTCVRAD